MLKFSKYQPKFGLQNKGEIIEFVTCIISQNDQQQQLTKTHKQPKSQTSLLPPLEYNREFDKGSCAFRSLGPLMSVIAEAPVTHTTVPSIFAMVLKLRILIGSNLMTFINKN